MVDWQKLSTDEDYAAAEASMLQESDRGEGYFPENEVRASFYENWGDQLVGDEQIEKYELALTNWEMWAACSTSGGEGTARMMEVKRVRRKIEQLGAVPKGW